MSSHETSASLRIHSETLTPAEITAVLEIKPDKAFTKGEKISAKGDGIRHSSMWVLNSKLNQEQSLGDQILSILQLLDSVKTKFETIAAKLECDIFCSYSSANGQGSIEIDRHIIRKLNDYSLDIVVDLYLTDDKN